jgi:hypothetical protein
MADDPAPARDFTSDEFRRTARTAGDALKDRLEKDLESAAVYRGFLDFQLRPYEDLLREVMNRFEEDVSGFFVVLKNCDLLILGVSISAWWR